VAPLIIAHRTSAAELGADVVEVDLRLSLDLQPFLMHDDTMRRTTGWPLPLELTPASVVRRQRLANGEPVPSLAQLFDALPPALDLAVDVKTPWAVVALIREIRRRRIAGRVRVWCTSALAVRYAVRAAPEVDVAYLKDVLSPRGKRAFIRKARRLGARAVSAHWRAIDAAFVAEAHALGLRVYSWHAAYPLTPERLTAGLDGLITDVPVEARRALAGCGLV
jgi:glycerophosphoryl diester phosphodiesterase